MENLHYIVKYDPHAATQAGIQAEYSIQHLEIKNAPARHPLTDFLQDLILFNYITKKIIDALHDKILEEIMTSNRHSLSRDVQEGMLIDRS